MALDWRTAQATVLHATLTLRHIAEALGSTGRAEQEIEVRREIVSALEAQWEQDPTAMRALGVELSTLAELYARRKDFPAAIADARRCREVVGGPQSEGVTEEVRRCVAWACFNVGSALHFAGRSEEALEWFATAGEYYEVLYAEAPDRYRDRYATVRNDWACALLGLDADPKRLDEAMRQVEASLDLLSAAAEPESFAYSRATALDTKADVLRELGRLEEARSLRGQSLELLRPLVAAAPERAGYAKTAAEVERKAALD